MTLRKILPRSKKKICVSDFRRRRIEGQVEVEEHIPGAVVDVHFAHASSFHHAVEGREVFFDEADEIERIVLDTCFRCSEVLDAGEVGEKAQGHHLQGLGLQIAEEEPVGPDFVEVLVESADFRDGVEFVRIVVPAIYQELEGAHHICQGRTSWQGCRTEVFEEVGELALAHLLFAEHDDDDVFSHGGD